MLTGFSKIAAYERNSFYYEEAETKDVPQTIVIGADGSHHDQDKPTEEVMVKSTTTFYKAKVYAGDETVEIREKKKYLGNWEANISPVIFRPGVNLKDIHPLKKK